MQRKTNDQGEQERKMSLVHFAHATRSQFLKLVALVKWIRISKRMDVCYSIDYLLDLQSQYFIDTADRLVAMTRGDLELARLPEYHIAPAIDVLVLGTYNRMPSKIKEAFIPPAKITPREQKLVTSRLNQLIESRLSRLSSGIPPNIKEIHINNGLATLLVPGEFEIKITLLGETEMTKWTLLNIKILVEDYELGMGLPLVHPLQLNQLHGVLQSRMNVSLNPIKEAFSFLHSFCVSLQLDVLFCQTSRLAAGRLRDNITIEKYDPKERVLVVGYWVKRSKSRRLTVGQVKCDAQYRVQIYEDPNDKLGGLKVRHFPHAPQLGRLDSGAGMLSIDRLLSETYVVRCKERLMRLRRILEAAEPRLEVKMTGISAPSLSLALLPDTSSKDEMMTVSVNSFCGKVLCNVHILSAEHEDVLAFGKALYSSQCSAHTIQMYLRKLRVALVIERYRRSVKALPVREVQEAELLPFAKECLGDAPAQRIILQFLRSEDYYLLVTFSPDEKAVVKTHIQLLEVVGDRAQFIQLEDDEMNGMHVKEAINQGTMRFSPSHKTSLQEECSREQRLAFAVATVEDRITYMYLAAELMKKGIGVDVRKDSAHVPGGLALHITDVKNVVPFEASEFFECCIRCCLRLDNRNRYTFQFEMCFENIPLVRDVPHGLPHRRDGEPDATWLQELNHINQSSPEKLVELIIHRLMRYLYMYKVVHQFSLAYEKHFKNYCNIEAYTFHKLVVSYGDNRDMLMILAFNVKSQAPGSSEDFFFLNFGQSMPHRQFNSTEIDWHQKPRWNPHSMMSQLMRDDLKETNDLVFTMHFLCETIRPLVAIGNFSRIRFQSQKSLSQLIGPDVHFPFRLKYHLYALDQTTLRLMQGNVILEIKLLEGCKIAVRDVSRYRPRCAGLFQLFSNIDSETTAIMNDEIAIPQSDNPQTAGPTMWTPEQFMDSLDERPEEIDPRMAITSQPILMSHDTIIKACDFKDTEGRITCPLDEYLCSISYLQRALLTLERMSPRATLNKNSSSNLSCGFVTIIDAKPDFIRFRASQMNGDGVNATSMVHYKIYLCPVAMTLKIRIEFEEGTNSAATADNLKTLTTYFEKVVFPCGDEYALQSYICLTRLTSFEATQSIANLMNVQMEHPPTSKCCVQLSLTYNNTSTKKLAPATKVDQPLQNIIFNVIVSQSRTSESFSVLRFIYRIKENFVVVPSANEKNKQMADEVNAETKTSGGNPIWNLVRLVMDRFNSGDWNPGNRDEPIISSVAPPTYVNPGSVAGPSSVAAPGSVSIQQPGSVLQPGSMMGPQSVNALQYGMHRQPMGGPQSMQMNPSSVGQPGSVGGPGSHQQHMMNPGSVGPGSVGGPGSVNPGSVGYPQWNPPSVGQSYHHPLHHQQYPPQ
ncbi:Mediator of RNA polymerase II transcription subunit 14 [Caenorhabditis elegans]|uniref:Isoform a of Mediator of RNA polymerase II transcription subunit 14 n=1 Tax=Caenorhabditis elegans TaxID=6239 RepID=Q03570-2|nr:Mediator of RNA polymerase II transcription subunit 14 [Caenorhabditis elegans]CAA79551.3 Mediator of RNA polymerase II transcription subunit 14 [Caenorhabditis elegans]|eukprot:NP_499068.3 Mediator of RNA polymerase II transcription subunit 14 [Caenorhabditis elegans]